MNAFQLTSDGRPVHLTASSQRVVALLAVSDRPIQRAHVAGTLWFDSDETRAAGNLRSAVWRLNGTPFPVVRATAREMLLHPSVSVDLHETVALARRLVNGASVPEDFDVYESALTADLLPDWYDEWIVAERERFRQLRLHALEALCRGLTAAGRYPHAVQAGLAAIAGEPLRESAHRALIAAHLAQGNAGEAVRQYRLYRELLRDELAIEPSPQMNDLVASIGAITLR